MREAQPLAAASNSDIYDYLASQITDNQRIAALENAMATLSDGFGNWQVPWGEINRYQRNDGAIVQQFDDSKPSLPVAFASARWARSPPLEVAAILEPTVYTVPAAIALSRLSNSGRKCALRRLRSAA